MKWFENEAFWRDFYAYMFDDNRFASAASEVERVLAIASVHSGAVLDLCCGPARHAIHLASRGFQVTGVDRSPFLLSKARERVPAGNTIEFVEADMRDFVREGAFDLAVSLFTSFGYFETRGEDLAVLRNIKASLKKGGIFVIDVISKEYLAGQACRNHWDEFPNGDILVKHAAIAAGWSQVNITWLLVQAKGTMRYDFQHNIYSGQELLALLEQAGFSNIQLFGSLDQIPYDSTATRLIARAEA